MTPDKCEHANILYRYLEHGRDAAFLECAACGQRFVPSDVLEEAREALSAIQDRHCTRSCDPPTQRRKEWEHKAVCKSAVAALVRIDEVLGKK